MTLETPLWIQAAVGDPAIQYAGAQDRALFDALITVPGVIGDADLQVSQRAAGANFSVDVATGTVMVQGTTLAYQGKYLCRSTSVVNVAMPSPPGTGTRTDLVVAQVYDKQSDGGTANSWTPLGVQGTTAPPNSTVLAQVVRTAGEASIVSASIVDARGYANTFAPAYFTTVQVNVDGLSIAPNTQATLGWNSIIVSGTRPLWVQGNPSGFRMTAPVKGLYDLSASLIACIPGGSSGMFDAAFRANGSQSQIFGLGRIYPGPLSRNAMNIGFKGYPLNAGDYVEVVCAGSVTWFMGGSNGGFTNAIPQPTQWSMALSRQRL